MLAVILTILGILFFIKWLQTKPFFWRGKNIQYSTSWPIVGSMGVALTKPIYEVWPSLYKKSGKSGVLGMHFFSKLGLLLTDPEVVKRLSVTDADYFQAHASIEADRSYDPLGESVFFVEGDEWKETRSLMSPYFTPLRIKGMLPIFNPIAETFMEHMVKHKGPFDIHVLCMQLSVETVMSAIFGLRANSFEDTNSQFYNILEETRRMTFILRGTLAHVSKTLYRLLGLTVFSKEATEVLKKFANDVLDQRLQGIGNRPDFMEGMTDLFRKEMEKSTENNIMQFNPDGTKVAKFTRYSIAGHCMMMFGAGTETTGNTLSFLLYELALNTEIQDKVRNEIQLMLRKTNGNFNLEDMYQMKYVFMVLKEALRKYPVFTAYGRKCTKKYMLDDLEIPVGTVIMLPVIAFHYDPKYFPEPQKFMPERFEDESKIISGSYIPFGIGPRKCIEFTRYSIAGHCMMMFGAGSETTGNTLSFLLYELALNTEIQDKVRNEIKLMLRKTNGNFNLEDMYQMKYVFMVLKEALRKYPVFTAYGRKCTKKYMLDNLEIPVGTVIMLPIIALHHDPKYFPEPQKFMPERFEDESKIISGSYIPFGIGPRKCIGMRFTETEIVLALVKLLPKHRLSVCSKTEIPVQFSNMFVLSPKNGIWLNVEEIN